MYFTFLCLVEEPSYDFIRLRDYVDALDCSKLSAFAPDNLCNGFSDKMVQQAREERKINKVSNNMERETLGPASKVEKAFKSKIRIATSLAVFVSDAVCWDVLLFF